jgi:hypothetical protein
MFNDMIKKIINPKNTKPLATIGMGRVHAGKII